jgi:hypothetical protein
LLGVPQSLIRDKRKVDELRATRQEQQAQIAQQQMAQQGQMEMQSATAKRVANGA